MSSNSILRSYPIYFIIYFPFIKAYPQAGEPFDVRRRADPQAGEPFDVRRRVHPQAGEPFDARRRADPQAGEHVLLVLIPETLDGVHVRRFPALIEYGEE